MNYVLAKQLEEAGFPQAGGGTWIGPPDSLTWRSGDQVYVPTLEELLLACGEEFDCMERHEGGQWLAWDGTGRDSHTGNSASEAVARLWIALRLGPAAA